MSALYKRISDGKVSFNELEAAVAAATSEGGQFYNGMLEASQTFNGRLSTLKDNVAALTGELTSGLFSALGDIIVKANELVVSITEDDSKMAALKETIGVLTAAVVAVTAAVLSYKATVAAATAITALHTAATTAMAAAHKAAAAGATWSASGTGGIEYRAFGQSHRACRGRSGRSGGGACDRLSHQRDLPLCCRFSIFGHSKDSFECHRFGGGLDQ